MSNRGGADAPFLEMAGIAKHYGGVHALQDVDFACRRHSIHAVLGENGAGKSTLIKIAAGVVRPDAGAMRLAGEEVRFATPPEAMRKGIVCVFQELSLVPDLSVADNIFITQPPGKWGFIDRRCQRRRAEALPRPCRLRGHRSAGGGRVTCRSRAASLSSSRPRWHGTPRSSFWTRPPLR